MNTEGHRLATPLSPADLFARLRAMEWKRDWKIQLIEKNNPFWEDLAVSVLGFEPLGD